MERKIKSSKSLGILGGMGPLASSEFLASVLNNFHVEHDHEYPRIVLDSNTLIPSRSRAFLYNEDSPVPGMVEACKKLEGYNVDYIAIPCNSAQAWLHEIQPEIATPILDIRKITTSALVEQYPDCRQAVVLGGPVTYGMETYAAYLKKQNIASIKITPQEQDEVEKIIYACKKNQDRRKVEEMYSKLLFHIEKNYGGVIVLGCTEFGLLTASASVEIRTLDSMRVYADFTANILKNGDSGV